MCWHTLFLQGQGSSSSQLTQHPIQDVFVYWVGWGLCFFAYYLKAESFVVAAAGLVMASFTYRQALTTSEVNGQSFEGTTGNLASVPALVMCGNFYRNDLGHQKNTGATWDPDYAARSSLNGYSYAMEKDDAKMCTAGLSLMYVPARHSTTASTTRPFPFRFSDNNV